jgi:hypothetical protein
MQAAQPFGCLCSGFAKLFLSSAFLFQQAAYLGYNCAFFCTYKKI